MSTGQVSTLPGSQGFFSPRWSPEGRYIQALSQDSKTLLLYDFQTQKWVELATGTIGWLNWSRDGQNLIVLGSLTGTGTVLKIRLSDHKVERVVDLKNFVSTGHYGIALALAPDDSPVMLREAGTYDVYGLDWEAP